MKNTINDLNNILFEQLERINDDSLKGEELQEALNKAEAINRIAGTLISSASVQIKAYDVFGKAGGEGVTILGIEG